MADFLFGFGHGAKRLLCTYWHDTRVYRFSDTYVKRYGGAATLKYCRRSCWDFRPRPLLRTLEYEICPYPRCACKVSQLSEYVLPLKNAILVEIIIIIIIIKAASSDDRALAPQRMSKWRSVEGLLSVTCCVKFEADPTVYTQVISISSVMAKHQNSTPRHGQTIMIIH